MKIHDIIIHFDTDRLGDTFLNKSALTALQKLNPDLLRPKSLLKLIEKQYPDHVILRNKKMRKAIINGMDEKNIERLAHNLELKSVNDVYDIIGDMKIRKNSKTEKIFFDFFEVEYSELETQIVQKPIDSVSPKRELFDFQRVIITDIFTKLNSKPPRALLHMPTGSGKTRTAMRIITQMLNKHEPSLIIWLAYNEELCEQSMEEFQSTWNLVGNRKINTFKFYSNHSFDIRKSLDKLKDGYMVASLGKIFNAAKKDHNILPLLADRVKLVIIDEAHQSIAKTYKFVLEQLSNKNDDVMLLGLSATPGRTWNDRNMDKLLTDFFHKKKVKISKSYGNPIKYLIKNGYLAKPTFIPLKYNGSQLTEEEIKQIEENLDIPANILRKLASDNARNIQIVHNVEELVKSGHKRIILFAATVQHAQDMAIVLSARNHKASFVTSDTPHDLRKSIIEDYRNSDDVPKILCNYGVLTTGFDAPRTSGVLIARSTTSLVLYSQMIGRGIRGYKAGGNKECTIITIVDTDIPSFGDIADMFANWEDVW